MISLTALILTYNEQENLHRTLNALAWIPKVLVIDSFSTDRTIEIAGTFPNVAIKQRVFDSLAAQCNYGLDLVQTDWVLSIDADYVVSAELAEEIRSVLKAEVGDQRSEISGQKSEVRGEKEVEVAGYSAGFRYCVFGIPLRTSLYPPRTVLYRPSRARYWNEGHGHRVVIGGRVEKLNGKIDHDDRKPLSRWLQAQDRYAELEARYLLQVESSRNAGEGAAGLSKEKVEDRAKKVESEKAKVENVVSGQKVAMRNAECGMRNFSKQDKIRKMIFIAPIIMPIYLLFARGLILDGWRGWYYVFQRTIAEMMLSLRLIEARRSKN